MDSSYPLTERSIEALITDRSIEWSKNGQLLYRIEPPRIEPLQPNISKTNDMFRNNDTDVSMNIELSTQLYSANSYSPDTPTSNSDNNISSSNNVYNKYHYQQQNNKNNLTCYAIPIHSNEVKLYIISIICLRIP